VWRPGQADELRRAHAAARAAAEALRRRNAALQRALRERCVGALGGRGCWDLRLAAAGPVGKCQPQFQDVSSCPLLGLLTIQAHLPRPLSGILLIHAKAPTHTRVRTRACTHARSHPPPVHANLQPRSATCRESELEQSSISLDTLQSALAGELQDCLRLVSARPTHAAPGCADGGGGACGSPGAASPLRVQRPFAAAAPAAGAWSPQQHRFATGSPGPGGRAAQPRALFETYGGGGGGGGTGGGGGAAASAHRGDLAALDSEILAAERRLQQAAERLGVRGGGGR
jgi:hypothetical protein